MRRLEVLGIVIKHLRANAFIPNNVEIDPTKSMQAQGAKSLEATHAIYGVMRELNIDLPLKSISNLETIDQFVDLFVKTINEES